MPYTTLSSGLTIKVPTRGTVNWAQTMLTDTFQKISQHGHTGSGDGTKITQSALNLAAGSTRAMPPLISQIQDGSVLYGGTSGGTANAQTITLAPAITALVAGMALRFKVGSGLTNTGATTINPNGIGAIDVKKLLGGGLYPLTKGDIIAGSYCELLSDGTNLILLNPAGPNVISREGTAIAVSNDATTTTLATFTILGGSLGPYGRIRGEFNGRFTNNSGGSMNFIANTTIGGNGVASASINLAAAAGANGMQGRFDIAARDLTSAVAGGMTLVSNAQAAAGSATLAKDMTVDQTFVLTMKMSSAVASTSFDVWERYIEFL